jgi:hypothetical protein
MIISQTQNRYVTGFSQLDWCVLVTIKQNYGREEIGGGKWWK